MKYVNGSGVTRTFHGVEIKPGETKDVPGFINVDGFYLIPDGESAQKAVEEPKAEPEEKKSTQTAEQVEVKTTRSKKLKDGEN